MTQNFRATRTRRGDHEALQIQSYIAELRQIVTSDPDPAKQMQARLMLERLS